MSKELIPIEFHPLEPFLPEGAKILMLGSFPPKKERWSMDFFYPNFINDMWRIMGLIFFDDRNHFIAEEGKAKRFDKEKCIGFATGKGIAMDDTACQVRRLKDTAILDKIPECNAIVTTGQKATDVIVQTFGCKEPSTGEYVEIFTCERKMRFWRMPSSSRAYPLALEKKAAYYQKMFEAQQLTD